MSFGVNFDEILFNKNIQTRIIFICNNDIAAARVELWSSSGADWTVGKSVNYRIKFTPKKKKKKEKIEKKEKKRKKRKKKKKKRKKNLNNKERPANIVQKGL